jgi:hypothetical protein
MNEEEEKEAEFQKLLKEIKAEEEQELKSMAEGGELGLKMDEDLEAEYTQLLKQSGLNVEQLELQERKDAEATEKWIAEVTPALVMGGGEQQLALQQLAEEREESLVQSLAGEDVEILTPAEVTVSDTDTLTMDWIPSKLCWKVIVSVKGAGLGCVGGSARRRVCVDWFYRFRPRWTKWYRVVPNVVYNGFCIVRASESWYCKYAQAKIDLGVNARQYNWKGWSWWNVFNVESSDILVNRRFDTTRRVNYGALLRRNVLAWIRVRTCLYVYAKGSGSYAKLDFSTGSNRICAPWLYVG